MSYLIKIRAFNGYKWGVEDYFMSITIEAANLIPQFETALEDITVTIGEGKSVEKF